MQNTCVKLNEPSMYIHGLGTLETERLNVGHIVDMMNIESITPDHHIVSRNDEL